RDPVRHALRRLLLEERAAGQPFAPALHRERPVLQVRDDRVGDLVVIVEEVALRDPVVRKENAVGGAELDLLRAHSTSMMGNRASRVSQACARSTAPMSPVSKDTWWRACPSAVSANDCARSSQTSSPVSSYVHS